MVDNQENLLSFQRYTEDDVIYWMGVPKGTSVWYYIQFGDGPQVKAEFIELTKYQLSIVRHYMANNGAICPSLKK